MGCDNTSHLVNVDNNTPLSLRCALRIEQEEMCVWCDGMSAVTLSCASPFRFVWGDRLAKTSQGSFHVAKCALDVSVANFIVNAIGHHVMEFLAESWEEGFTRSICFSCQNRWCILGQPFLPTLINARFGTVALQVKNLDGGFRHLTESHWLNVCELHVASFLDHVTEETHDVVAFE